MIDWTLIILAIFQVFIMIILSLIGFYARGIVRSQEKIEKAFTEFKNEVPRAYASRRDFERLQTDLSEMGKHVDAQDRDNYQRLWDRIHKLIADDINPLHDNYSELRSEVSVLKAQRK